VSNTKLLNWSFRLKACFIHFCASGFLAAIVAAIVFAMWYPNAYRKMSGGTELFLLVVGVDMVIGPLITLVIFDKRKPISELRRDIAIVVVLQLAALTYGLHTVSISRPVALALEEDRFRVVAAIDVYKQELPLARSDFRSLSLTGPRLVWTSVPSDPKEKSDALSLALKGFDIGTRPSLWKPWDKTARDEALTNAKPITALRNRYRDRSAELAKAIAETETSSDTLAYIPIITFHGDWVALLDTNNGDVVGFAPFDGF
jgi:hypothetical protein